MTQKSIAIRIVSWGYLIVKWEFAFDIDVIPVILLFQSDWFYRLRNLRIQILLMIKLLHFCTIHSIVFLRLCSFILYIVLLFTKCFVLCEKWLLNGLLDFIIFTARKLGIQCSQACYKLGTEIITGNVETCLLRMSWRSHEKHRFSPVFDSSHTPVVIEVGRQSSHDVSFHSVTETPKKWFTQGTQC